MKQVNWAGVLKHAKWRELDDFEREAFSGAGPDARIGEWLDVVVLSDIVDGVRVFQAFGEPNEMLDELRMPEFVN